MKPNIYLKLANNRILEDCQAGATESSLWLYLKGMTMADAAALAFDKEALKRIEFHYGLLHTTHEDYDTVTAIMDRGSVIEVCLTGGRTTEEDVKDERDPVKDGSDRVS